LSEAKAGLSGTVSSVSASTTSSFSRPARSGPNSTPQGSPSPIQPRMRGAAPFGVSIGFSM